MTTVLDLMEDAARGDGKIRFLPSGDVRSIGDIWRDAEAAAGALSAGFAPGEAVGALLSSSPLCIAGLVGAWRAGLDLVSLPLPARGMAIEEYVALLDRITEQVGARAVLVESEYAPFLEQARVEVIPFDEALSGGAGSRGGADAVGRLIQYTSGSTSDPKGVVLSLESVAANASAILGLLEPNDRDKSLVSWLPLSHDMGLIGSCISGWIGLRDVPGGQLVLIRPESFLAQPSMWLEACSEYRASFTMGPSWAFGRAARRASRSGALDLSSLRICITGAETVSAEALRTFSGTFSDAGFRPSAFCPAYGLAEATLAVTMVRPDEEWQALSVDREALGENRWVETAAEGQVELVGNGRPLSGVDVQVAAPPGCVGPIAITSPGLFDGYVGQTPRAADSSYETSDLGYVRDGQLYITGRIDDMISVRGRNLYAADVEKCLSAAWLRAGTAVVIGNTEGQMTVLVEAVPEVTTGTLPGQAELKTLRRQVISALGIGPSRIFVVPSATIPKTPSGKPQRYRARSLLESGRFEFLASASFD